MWYTENQSLKTITWRSFMIKVFRSLSFFLTLAVFISGHGLAQDTEKPWYGMTEETITTTVPFKSGLFSSVQQVQISGVLWTPNAVPGTANSKIPLVVYSHGSQNPKDGSRVDYIVRAGDTVLTMLKQGSAVFMPIRKGFYLSGKPSTISADDSEPVDCRSFSLQENGLMSAKSDVLALLRVIEKRSDLDTNKIVLAGQSRGGFVSLALAADGLPGVVGVLNFSGGWHGEPCSPGAGFNQIKLKEFGARIKVPVYSYYGDSDPYYSTGYVTTFLQLLAKNEKARGQIVLSGGHSAARGSYDIWGKDLIEMMK
jgi:dienelactone hydrolase